MHRHSVFFGLSMHNKQLLSIRGVRPISNSFPNWNFFFHPETTPIWPSRFPKIHTSRVCVRACVRLHFQTYDCKHLFTSHCCYMLKQTYSFFIPQSLSRTSSAALIHNLTVLPSHHYLVSHMKLPPLYLIFLHYIH